MDDEAEVGLVEAHPERRCGDERLDPVLDERRLGVQPLGGVGAAAVGDDVVPGGPQERRQVLGAGDGERVDDAAARQVGEVLGEPAELLVRGAQAQHAEAQALALERAAQHEHVVRRAVGTDGQLVGDVVDDALVGGGGRGQHRDVRPQPRQRFADAPVVGPEVVAPVGDAVGLVDDEQPDALGERGQQAVAEVRVVEALRADQQHVDRAGAQAPPRRASHSSVFDELMVWAVMPARAAASTWLRISASSGDTISVGPAPCARSSPVATK